jgi:ubiquinone/menaquinone biosynthesis C-methylase UbiE
MDNLLHKYEIKNIEHDVSEYDPFKISRYEQFLAFFPKYTVEVLDIGCCNGKGGSRLKELNPSLTLLGLDCVQARLDALPECYAKGVYGLSTNIPIEDKSIDEIVAGEFIEHLYPADVDPTLCEFQRVLKIGGRLLITTPNPNYLKKQVD